MPDCPCPNSQGHQNSISEDLQALFKSKLSNLSYHIFTVLKEDINNHLYNPLHL